MEIHKLLEEGVKSYNSPAFIREDPIYVPHQFSTRENIELAGFLSATLAWGQRKVTIRSATDLIKRMDNRPFDFLYNLNEYDLEAFRGFRHRTFSEEDCSYFIRSLSRICRRFGGLYPLFLEGYHQSSSVQDAILRFREEFFILPHPSRTTKHVSDPGKGSAAKRLNMFLRWMVRKDAGGVDFGIWEGIDPSHLMIPLDVHTGITARSMGLLARKQNDWKAVEELTRTLRQFDPVDPVKYDFALFGMGFNKDKLYAE